MFYQIIGHNKDNWILYIYFRIHKSLSSGPISKKNYDLKKEDMKYNPNISLITVYIFFRIPKKCR